MYFRTEYLWDDDELTKDQMTAYIEGQKRYSQKSFPGIIGKIDRINT